MSGHVFDLSGEKDTLTVAKTGKIASVSGTVLIQNDKGEMVALHAGQSLNPGDHIILVSGTFTITLDNGEQLVVGKQVVFGEPGEDAIGQPDSSHEQQVRQKTATSQQSKNESIDKSDTDGQQSHLGDRPF